MVRRRDGLTKSRIAKETVGKRFGPNAETAGNDMLGSFIRHGLTQEEAESETVLQMSVYFPYSTLTTTNSAQNRGLRHDSRSSAHHFSPSNDKPPHPVKTP